MSAHDNDELLRLVRSGYDQLVDRYVEEFFGELDRKPFDRELLDEFADRAGEGARACDIGCGPGHIAAYLAGRGLTMSGVDVSPNMVHRARALNAGIEFAVGDMRRLESPDGAYDGVVAFYSIIHLTRADAPTAVAELARVLKPGGELLISFHAGTGDVYVADMLGEPVPMYATYYSRAEMSEFMRDVGLEVLEAISRPAYDFEFQSERGYVLARRPK
jgi:ubiquinone/menaquinone biosynthesis C-methylase UbiE